jgi:hypothetical protein
MMLISAHKYYVTCKRLRDLMIQEPNKAAILQTKSKGNLNYFSPSRPLTCNAISWLPWIATYAGYYGVNNN